MQYLLSHMSQNVMSNSVINLHSACYTFEILVMAEFYSPLQIKDRENRRGSQEWTI
jgi:hypothetical protein